MLNRSRLLASVCLLLSVLAGCTFFQPTDVTLSGTIEAEELPIVAEVGGAIQSVHVEEGAVLHKNQVLAELDKRSYQIGVNEAEALVAQAEAKLEEAKAGARNQTVKKGIAAMQQADANIQLAQAREKQAEANLNRAKEQLAQTESQLTGARQTLAYQQSRLKEAAQLFERGAISKKDYEAQQEAVNVAQTQVNQLTAQAAASRSQFASAKEDVTAAKAQTETARAQLASASAELDLLQEGSTDYAIRALLAARQQAMAKRDLAKLQLEKAVILAPEDGILLRKNVSQGEVAKTGATLFTMMKKDQLKVKVYIPEAELGSIKTGQRVGIQVDAYPGETFTGVISAISDKAEFTPKNVQTKDERTKLVFAVTIRIQDGLDKLKPGMPADVLLSQGGEGK
ncbi:HlyD family secretion protein [Brevibacillus sp. H7]|uniref:HlyD family secretion protein n=1 Tax=Brevibacillus sp. H7 TaxID=3349138 RepID=UPI00381A7F21